MRLLILFVLVCLLTLASCESESEKLANEKKQAVLDSLERNKDLSRLREIDDKYNHPDFIFRYDEFEDYGYYDVETSFQTENPPSAMLWIKISDEGYLGFASVYFARERIFHTRIKVKIGDSVYTSEEVPLNSKHNIVEGKYVENVWFLKDSLIIKSIALSKNEDVSIRLIGNENYTYSLSAEDIIKIKDCYEFAGLLKKLKLPAKEQVIFGP